MFNAVLLTQSDGKTHAAVVALDDDALPPDGDVLVAIDYSTINYKDGLAITGKAPVVRSWPMVAGIDGAGTVLASKHAAWRPGERVVLNGYGVGETHWGCLAQKARLRGDWLVKLPERFSSRDAMIIGTAGFFSKDAIVESAFVGHNAVAGFAFVLLVIAACFTSFYSWRLIFMTFHGKSRASHEVMHHVHESPPVMLLPLFILAVGALFAGIIFHGAFIGEGYAEFWKASLFTLPDNHILHEIHETPLWVELSPFIAMVIGLLVAWKFYIRSPQIPVDLAAQHRGLYAFLLNKWYFDELYDFLFVRPAKRLGRFLWKTGDGAVIDGLGPDGISARVVDVTNRVVKLQTGYLYHYAFAMLIGVAALVTWMML